MRAKTSNKLNLWLVLFSILFVCVGAVFSLLISKGDFLLFLNKHHCEILDFYFKYITSLGNATFIIPLAAWIWLSNRSFFIPLVLVLIVQNTLIWIFKFWIFRNMHRPRIFFSDEFFESLHHVSGVIIHDRNSFPSGHTLTAFAMAFFLILIWKQKIGYNGLLSF